MKKITFFLTIFLFSIVANAQNKFGEISFNKAINISGKQRMLSQKISKTYLYILDNPNDSNAKKEFSTSKIIFEKHNEILNKNATSTETKAKIEAAISIWNQLAKIFSNKPNYKDVNKVISTNTILLNKTNDVVKSIIIDAESNNQFLDDDTLEQDINLKKIINICGKQRMLSQRLALYYLANDKKTQTEKTKSILETTYTNLDDVISELLISDFNTATIETTLGEAMTLWEVIKNNKDKLLNQQLDKKDIYNRTNDLTIIYNKLTLLYEKVK